MTVRRSTDGRKVMDARKVTFSVTMQPSTVAEIEKIRGQYARSVVIEALCIECLGLPEESTVYAEVLQNK